MSRTDPQPPFWRRPLDLAGRIRLVFIAAVVAVAGAAALGAAFGALLGPLPPVVFAIALLAGLTVGLWLLQRVLRPASRVLGALRDGVLGFRDHDFSLSLAVDREDELGELVSLYNAVGEVLRQERSALVQKEMLLETVLQTAPQGIVLTNARGRVVLANREARRMLPMPGGLEGQLLEDVLERCPGPMRSAFEAGAGLFSVEGSEDEETYHLACSLFDLNAQRHALYFIKRLTPELRRREVAVWKKLIRLLSHEINNSLAPIASLSRSGRLLIERSPPAAGQEADRLASLLEVIEERSRHLHDFLAGYAQFARLPRPRPELVDWEPFLADLALIVPFRLEGPPPPRPGCFDRAQLQQGLINLLKNAHEAGSPQNEVALRIDDLGEAGTRLAVLDRGAGMDGETLSQALLPFYSSKKSGTGLGLPLCREIVEAHGGRLRIEGRQGGGTVVVCWLPPPEEEPRASRASGEP